MDLFHAATSKTMIPLPPQAMKALKDREAKEKGTLWVSEVSDANVDLFLHYKTWAHVYEGAPQTVNFAANSVTPAQEPSIASEADVPEKLSGSSAHVEDSASLEDYQHNSSNNNINKKPNLFAGTKNPGPYLAAQLEKAQKAQRKDRMLASKNDDLCTLRSGLSAKLVLMVLDMSCHLLQDLEDSLEDQRQFVNIIRALVLTYRFEKPNMRRKIFHLREVMCTRLVTLLDLKLRDQTLAETQLACREGLSKMDVSVLLEREWNAWIERFVAVGTKERDDFETPSTTDLDETLLTITGLEPPATFEIDSAIDIRNQCFQLIKGFVKEKMKSVHKVLAYGVDQLFMSYAEAKFAPNTSKAALPLNEEMVRIVDNIHERLWQSVTQEVSGIVDLLGDMMALK